MSELYQQGEKASEKVEPKTHFELSLTFPSNFEKLLWESSETFHVAQAFNNHSDVNLRSLLVIKSFLLNA